MSLFIYWIQSQQEKLFDEYDINMEVKNEKRRFQKNGFEMERKVLCKKGNGITV